MPIPGPFPVPSKTLAEAKSEILAGLTLQNVNNTSDASKPISTLTQTALNLKADASALTSGLAGKAAVSHTHAQSEITGLVTALSGKVASNITQGGTGSIAVTNFVAITEANYNLLVTPDATTAYLIIEP
jgi:hypothetical protein